LGDAPDPAAFRSTGRSGLSKVDCPPPSWLRASASSEYRSDDDMPEIKDWVWDGKPPVASRATSMAADNV
jgi:hypothetical protein